MFTNFLDARFFLFYFICLLSSQLIRVGGGLPDVIDMRPICYPSAREENRKRFCAKQISSHNGLYIESLKVGRGEKRGGKRWVVKEEEEYTLVQSMTSPQ